MAIVTPFVGTDDFSMATFNSRINQINTNIATDNTKALFDLSSDMGPNDIFAFLGKYNQYWWSVLHGEASFGYKEKQTLYSGRLTVTTRPSSVTVSVADTVTINQATGAVSLVNPQSVTISGSGLLNDDKASSFAEGMKVLLGKYVSGLSWSRYYSGLEYTDTDVFYIPSSAIPQCQYYSDAYDFVGYFKDSGYWVTSEIYNILAGETTYVNSSDRNAYPDSGMIDDLTYQYLGVPFNNAITAPKIVTGSYTGTGVSGSSDPNSLTFDEAPLMVIMLAEWSATSKSLLRRFPSNDGSVMYSEILTTEYQGNVGLGSSGSYGKKSADGKTFFWYSTDSGSTGKTNQFNYSGSIYYYVAVFG